MATRLTRKIGVIPRVTDGPVELTTHQKLVGAKIKSLLEEGNRDVTVGGLAGTGKTTVVSQLHGILGLNTLEIAYCAFTGKASTVINHKFPDAFATTIHSLIYQAAEVHCKQCPAHGDAPREDGKPSPRCHVLKTGCLDCKVMYRLRERLPAGKKLIIVDEASMVPEGLAEHLRSYGRPIIWVGDHGQLPPVQSTGFILENPDVRLTKIHRHAKESLILRWAMEARRNGRIPAAGYAQAHKGTSVSAWRGSRFEAREEDWLGGELAVLVADNQRRAAINRAVRRKRGFPADEPVVGDRVICLRNNRNSGVYNGLTGTIGAIEPSDWGEYALAQIGLDGEDRVYEGRILLQQFGERKTLADTPRREGDLWDYGYALTVHKAQGSEYDRVVVIGKGYRSNRKRWLYTAITRAKKQLEIIYPD